MTWVPRPLQSGDLVEEHSFAMVAEKGHAGSPEGPPEAEVSMGCCQPPLVPEQPRPQQPLHADVGESSLLAGRHQAE